MAGITLPVMAGLAIGITFIFIMMLGMQELRRNPFLTADYPPRPEFYVTDSGWVILETSRLDHDEYYDYNRQLIDIMLRNSTVAELLSGEYVLILGMGPSNCSFGPCAVARLVDMQERNRDIQLIMDYDNGKVLSIRIQNW